MVRKNPLMADNGIDSSDRYPDRMQRLREGEGRERERERKEREREESESGIEERESRERGNGVSESKRGETGREETRRRETGIEETRRGREIQCPTGLARKSCLFFSLSARVCPACLEQQLQRSLASLSLFLSHLSSPAI